MKSKEIFKKINKIKFFKLKLIFMIILFFIILGSSLFLILKPKENNYNKLPEDSSNVKIANPASVYCIENNGTLKIRTEESGQYGICIKGEKECEEWAFFRGECLL